MAMHSHLSGFCVIGPNITLYPNLKLDPKLIDSDSPLRRARTHSINHIIDSSFSDDQGYTTALEDEDNFTTKSTSMPESYLMDFRSINSAVVHKTDVHNTITAPYDYMEA